MVRPAQRSLEPGPSFTPMITSLPKQVERAHEAKGFLDQYGVNRLNGFQRPLERRPQIVVLLVQAIQPRQLRGPGQSRLGFFRKAKKIMKMRLTCSIALTT